MDEYARPRLDLRKTILIPNSDDMTPQEYIAANAPRFAARKRSTNNANKICKEIQTLCGCTAHEAVKTLIATFDVALKMRESINS